MTHAAATRSGGDSLLLVRSRTGRNRLGGSWPAQVYGRTAATTADCDDAASLRALFARDPGARNADLLLAYHDRSDGGVFATLMEMAFAGRCGFEVTLPGGDGNVAAALYSEELGAVLQVEATATDSVLGILAEAGLDGCATVLGCVVDDERIEFHHGERMVLTASRTALRAAWSETSFCMQALRDNPECAAEERARATDPYDPGLFVRLSYDPAQDVAAPFASVGARPRVAVLREQATHLEMSAACIARASRRTTCTTDLVGGRGGSATSRGRCLRRFSYGDVRVPAMLANPSFHR